MLGKGQRRRVLLNLGFGEKYCARGGQAIASIFSVPYLDRKAPGGKPGGLVYSFVFVSSFKGVIEHYSGPH